MTQQPMAQFKIVAPLPGVLVPNAIYYVEFPGGVYRQYVTSLLGVPRLVTGDAEGFGWVDYTDTTSGTETAIAAGVRTQVSREISATGANNKLSGHWLNHNFWGGIVGDRKIVGVSVNDVVAISIALRVRPELVGGILTLEVDVGGAVGAVVTKSTPLTGDVGELERMRIDATISMRATFLANGGRVYLTSTVPFALVEFSPEFYPIGFTA
jgi:hypothetical protein